MLFTGRQWLRVASSMVLALFASLTFSPTLPANAADLRSTPEAQITKLTPAQVQALRDAYSSHRALSVSEAKRLIARVGQPVPIGTPAYAGHAESLGDCSDMFLDGWSYGAFYWDNFVLGSVPDGAFGETIISTNGFTTASADFWVGGGRVYYGEGTIPWVGWGASATTMSAWLVLTDGSLCAGNLVAWWP